jgi:hypothetical protein
MKPVPVYQPELQVTLHKTIARKTTNGKDATSQRFQGAVDKRVIDLAPFIGEAGAVQTSKSVSEPAGGWQITLADRALQSGGTFESVYGLVEPMDMIEIRMRHGTPASAGRVPVVMRGFVTDVRRSEAMGGDGRPTRTVTLSGQDYGKVWQIIQINFFAAYLLGQAFLSDFKLFEQFGVGYETTLSPDDFIRQVVNKVINPYLFELMPENSTLPTTLQYEGTVKGGTVSPGLQTQEGTIYELLRQFGDVGPWNELFIEDREDGVYCVYRPNPYLDVTTGEKIQKDAPDPVYVEVDHADIMGMSVARSDVNVANFYWVDSPRFNLVTDSYRRQAAAAAGDPTVVLKDYPNSQAKLYGLRLLRVATQQGGSEMKTHNTGGKASDVQALEKSVAGWIDGRRRVLVETNRDNVLLEQGTIRMRGREDVKAGVYLRVRRGDFEATYYVIQVEHEFVPFVGFFTNVQVKRGTGFVRRITRGGSPYLSELS